MVAGEASSKRGDGRELYVRAPDNRLTVVDIRPGPTPGPPRALFHLTADVNNGRHVVMPDRLRFLVPLELEKLRPQIVITLNWQHAAREARHQARDFSGSVPL
jgi:hypothetical protein